MSQNILNLHIDFYVAITVPQATSISWLNYYNILLVFIFLFCLNLTYPFSSQ